MIASANTFRCAVAVALLLWSSSTTATNAFQISPTSSSTRNAFVVPQRHAKTPQSASRARRPTELFVSWPSWPGTKDDTKTDTAEGKRDSDSRLQLAGDEASELSISAVLSEYAPSTENIEEFVAPISNILDDTTGGWALSYANLEPEDESTPIGMAFLATNIAYGLAGSLLISQGNVFLGALTELACIASFAYHYTQLKFGQDGSRIVRLALLVDYVFAVSAILVGSAQLYLSHQLPTDAVLSGSLAVASLGACWVWEEGVIYILLHSLWHLFSAYTGYIIGISAQL